MAENNELRMRDKYNAKRLVEVEAKVQQLENRQPHMFDQQHQFIMMLMHQFQQQPPHSLGTQHARNQQPPLYPMYLTPTQPMSYMQQPPMSYMQQPLYQMPVYRPEMPYPGDSHISACVPIVDFPLVFQLVGLLDCSRVLHLMWT
ncbi:unnamed protein product [Malus baccata var. baccata]